jgi:N-acetylglucosamine-6-sulfatase
LAQDEGPSRRDLLRSSSMAAVLAGCGSGPAPQAPEPSPVPDVPDPADPRPNGRAPKNIVFVLTDDQRWDGFGAAGHPFLKTPNLDRMAREGALCSHAFVTTSLCCPSRATMLSGVYAHVHGVLDNVTPMPKELPTYPKVLRRAGYHTAYVGKWHMGGASAAPRPDWDHWVSFPGQGQYFYPGPEERPEAERAFNINGTLTPVEGYVTDLVTDHAIEALAQRPPDKPFCLVVGHKACHAPFQPAPRHRDALADVPVPTPLPDTEESYLGRPAFLRAMRKSIFGVERLYGGRWASFEEWYRDYHRTLLAVDEGLGRLLTALEEQGLLEDTVVVFTSDNGFMLGEKGCLDKRCFYEPSVRVPLLVLAKGAVAPGTVIDELVLNLDVAPSLLDIAGLKAPENMQGESIYPLLLGEKQKWRGDFLYEYFFEQNFPQTPTVRGVRGKSAKLITYYGVPDRDELFYLPDDPDEMNNRIADAEMGQRRKHLVKRLRQLSRRYGLRGRPDWGTAPIEPPSPKPATP